MAYYRFPTSIRKQKPQRIPSGRVSNWASKQEVRAAKTKTSKPTEADTGDTIGGLDDEAGFADASETLALLSEPVHSQSNNVCAASIIAGLVLY
jgi:hypothetical protein